MPWQHSPETCGRAPAQGWACTQIFEGHSHYVMQCVFNPKDTNTFASASLDRTVKVGARGLRASGSVRCSHRHVVELGG